MELELVPEQPPQIAVAITEILAETGPAGRRSPDSWWQAGIDEALEP